jgi:hypothetical protein
MGFSSFGGAGGAGGFVSQDWKNRDAINNSEKYSPLFIMALSFKEPSEPRASFCMGKMPARTT